MRMLLRRRLSPVLFWQLGLLARLPHLGIVLACPFAKASADLAIAVYEVHRSWSQHVYSWTRGENDFTPRQLRRAIEQSRRSRD